MTPQRPQPYVRQCFTPCVHLLLWGVQSLSWLHKTNTETTSVVPDCPGPHRGRRWKIQGSWRGLERNHAHGNIHAGNFITRLQDILGCSRAHGVWQGLCSSQWHVISHKQVCFIPLLITSIRSGRVCKEALLLGFCLWETCVQIICRANYLKRLSSGTQDLSWSLAIYYYFSDRSESTVTWKHTTLLDGTNWRTTHASWQFCLVVWSQRLGKKARSMSVLICSVCLCLSVCAKL